LPRQMAGGTLGAAGGNVALSVPWQYVDGKTGLRSLLILDDGVHTTTVDLSRKVSRTGSDPVTLDKGAKWLPLYATSELLDATPSSALRQLCPVGSSWAYDKKEFRMVRWFKNADNASASDKWVEFENRYTDQFAFVPGRTIWVAVKAPTGLNFGMGVTVSLKQSCEIKVPPGDWLDFGNPFKFSVRLKDVLDSTGDAGDTLQFYQWVNDSVYHAEGVHVPGIAENLNAVFQSDSLHGYTVFNPSSDTVVLRIPPLPSAATGNAKRTSASGASCLFSLKAVTGNNHVLNVAFCAIKPEKSRTRYYPAAPSFEDAGVRIIDSRTNKLYGHIAAGASESHGITVPLALFNHSRSDRRIACVLTTTGDFPKGWKTKLYDLQKKAWVSNTESGYSADVPAGGDVRFLLVAGSESHFAGFEKTISLYCFGLTGSFPNPFTRLVQLRYTLPFADINEISVTIVNVRGQAVWKNSMKTGFAPGMNTISWRAINDQGERVGAGVYFARIRILGKDNEELHRMNTKLIFTP
jgi:hypothetical protein